MFNLKDKLLKQGLVTKEMLANMAKAEEEAKGKKSALDSREYKLNQLKKQNKNDQYVTIRQWVDLNRLDKASEASLDDEKFFFNDNDKLSWLKLNKNIIEQIKNGDAGIVAYMSNHGLAHAVLTREIVEDIVHIFPDWLKVLNSVTL